MLHFLVRIHRTQSSYRRPTHLARPRWKVLSLLRLEDRRLLHGGIDDEHVHFDEVPHDLPVVLAPPAVGASPLATGPVPNASIPVLDSLPGAAASLYLDFNGHFEKNWGEFKNITTPPYDQDGNPSTFSSAEVKSMTDIWKRVAEDFAPFKINVTTVDPGNFNNRVALRASIGGDGSWIGPYGGVAYVNAFTNYIPNTVFIFSKNLSNGYPKYVSEAVSHESGHGFGLYHQSTYDKNGKKTNEYNPGSGDWAPIMGLSYYANRSTWYNGPNSNGPNNLQDDMYQIARTANGFGYVADDHANTKANATPLDVSGNQVSGSGLIFKATDLDYFSFYSKRGTVSFTVDVAQVGPDLDVKIQLWSVGGVLLGTGDPSNSYSATVTASVPQAASYRLLVTSHGQYGAVGRYTIHGTVVGSTSPTGAERTTALPLEANFSDFGNELRSNVGAILLPGDATVSVVVAAVGERSEPGVSRDRGRSVSLPAGPRSKDARDEFIIAGLALLQWLDSEEPLATPGTAAASPQREPHPSPEVIAEWNDGLQLPLD